MPQFIEEFVCAGCAHTGHATWQGEAGTARVLIELSDGFAQAPGGDPANDSRITCRNCGAIQPEQMDPAVTAHI
jgi:hypothetical protein